MFPSWKTHFDAHIYEGRVIEVVLMKSSEEPLAKATIGVSQLMERCKASRNRSNSELSLDLYPSGRVHIILQYFLEDTDTGKLKA